MAQLSSGTLVVILSVPRQMVGMLKCQVRPQYLIYLCFTPSVLHRSYIYLDGELIADHSGLHGIVQKCGQWKIGSFKVTGFQGGGCVGQHVQYSGPDNAGVTRWLRSTKAKYKSHGKPTKFSMYIFQAGYALSSVPWLGSLAYVGVCQMPVVDLNSAQDFRQVRNT